MKFSSWCFRCRSSSTSSVARAGWKTCARNSWRTGFIAVPTVALDEAVKRYGFRAIGRAANCRLRFHAITAERRIRHPAATAITAAALQPG